jgi:hypothetical protein
MGGILDTSMPMCLTDMLAFIWRDRNSGETLLVFGPKHYRFTDEHRIHLRRYGPAKPSDHVPLQP